METYFSYIFSTGQVIGLYIMTIVATLVFTYEMSGKLMNLLLLQLYFLIVCIQQLRNLPIHYFCSSEFEWYRRYCRFIDRLERRLRASLKKSRSCSATAAAVSVDATTDGVHLV